MYSLCTPDICDGTGDDPKCPHCSASRKREEYRDALRAEGAAAERARIVAVVEAERFAAHDEYKCDKVLSDGGLPCSCGVDADNAALSRVLALLQPPTTGGV